MRLAFYVICLLLSRITFSINLFVSVLGYIGASPLIIS